MIVRRVVDDLELMADDASVSTVQGLIPASSGTVESEAAEDNLQ